MQQADNDNDSEEEHDRGEGDDAFGAEDEQSSEVGDEEPLEAFDGIEDVSSTPTLKVCADIRLWLLELEKSEEQRGRTQ